MNKPDMITMDVPLFTRMLEWAREEAKTDVELHEALTRIIAAEGRPLNMSDYETLINLEKEEMDKIIEKAQHRLEVAAGSNSKAREMKPGMEEVADDAKLGPVTIGAGQLALADKLSLELGFVDGSMAHHLSTGMIGYMLVHPMYKGKGENKLSVQALKKSLRTNFLLLNRALGEIEEDYHVSKKAQTS